MTAITRNMRVEKFSSLIPQDLAIGTSSFSPRLLDKSKSFLVSTARVNTATAEAWTFTSEITDNATATFERDDQSPAGNAPVNIINYVIEAPSGVTVEHGSILDFSVGNNPQTVTLNNITDINKSFILFSDKNLGLTWGGDDDMSAFIFDDGQVKLTMELDVSSNNTTANYQIVQMDNIKVQRGSITTFSGTSVTANISPVDQNKAFLIFSARMPDSSTDSSPRRLRGRITSPTQLTFDRDSSAVAVTDLRWEVVEFTDNTRVTEVLSSFSATGTATPQTNSESISLTDPNNAFPIASYMQRYGKGDYSTNDQVDCVCALDITSKSNIDITRDSSFGTCDIAIYVIEFMNRGVFIT
ncbi:MAG: hypothetical protein ACYS5F_14615 [Planctomycetota bacterium]|jgi:hypothetical protein